LVLGRGSELTVATNMSSFFTAPRAQKKRKLSGPSGPARKRIATAKPPNKAPARAAPPPKKRTERDESISGSDSEESGDDDDEDDGDGSSDESDASGHEGETAAERRLRLAERYLDNVRKEVDEYAFDAEQIDKDLIAERLQEDVAEAKGKVYRQLAGELSFDTATSCWWKWNSGNVTAVATCAPYAYTVSQDAYLTKWRIQDLPQHQWPQTTRKKPKKPPAPPKKRPERIDFRRGDVRKAKDKNYQGHVGAILAVAASQDGKFVVTAGADRRLIVHDAETLRPLRVFTHHRDAVTGLAFRRGTNQLYTCSLDRTVKVWSVDDLAYIETLFGHQDGCGDIDALAQERCVSVGAKDRTARLWRIVEETQLVFRGGAVDKKPPPAGVDPRSLAREGSMDRIAMLDDDLFVTGSDNGALALWSTQKKKPLHLVSLAHGVDPALDPARASADKHPDPRLVPPPQPRWITALRTLPYSDVVLSGSWDGAVRVWKLSADKKKLEAVGVLGGGGGGGGAVDGEHGGSRQTNGVNGGPSSEADDPGRHIRGVINGISVFERGDRGKDGLCVVVAVGKDHRLGRWKNVKGGRNGAVVFEVPRIPKEAAVNGVPTVASNGTE